MTSHFRLRWAARRTEIDHRNQRLFCLRQRRRRGSTAQPGLQALPPEPGDKSRPLRSALPHFRPVSAFRWRRFRNLPAIVIAIRLAAAKPGEAVRQNCKAFNACRGHRSSRSPTPRQGDNKTEPQTSRGHDSLRSDRAALHMFRSSTCAASKAPGISPARARGCSIGRSWSALTPSRENRGPVRTACLADGQICSLSGYCGRLPAMLPAPSLPRHFKPAGAVALGFTGNLDRPRVAVDEG